MFKILFLLLLGVGIGYLLRNIRGIQKVDHTAHYTIIILLFIFGVSIGANHDLISNIGYFWLAGFCYSCFRYDWQFWNSLYV